MSESIHVKTVGELDPALRTSPVLADLDEVTVGMAQILPEASLVCYYNGVSYGQGQRLRHGDEILCCDNGAWVQMDQAG